MFSAKFRVTVACVSPVSLENCAEYPFYICPSCVKPEVAERYLEIPCQLL